MKWSNKRSRDSGREHSRQTELQGQKPWAGAHLRSEGRARKPDSGGRVSQGRNREKWGASWTVKFLKIGSKADSVIALNTVVSGGKLSISIWWKMMASCLVIQHSQWNVHSIVNMAPQLKQGARTAVRESQDWSHSGSNWNHSCETCWNGGRGALEPQG